MQRSDILRAGANRAGQETAAHAAARRWLHRRAPKGVILSAGSINSPHLLMLSGVGDPIITQDMALFPTWKVLRLDGI
ncbi:GMC family oxidoreductase N-terminal domain-containing protein [Bradyrhizobium sacchari]|uniref:GMC family oxidoreductase N-terminal domain-containing protein n=1 Tax=Bradyrhizobium sacchari TaxID=1399419 RepID=UPI001FD948E9|nr:GMC family oxidoreductase N-terminal domain-containing protein [Bradyrhizobium sacchari]